MREKKPIIVSDKVVEKMSIYTLEERLKYWDNNPVFKQIPTNQDIHIHNTWKNIKIC